MVLKCFKIITKSVSVICLTDAGSNRRQRVLQQRTRKGNCFNMSTHVKFTSLPVILTDFVFVSILPQLSYSPSSY